MKNILLIFMLSIIIFSCTDQSESALVEVPAKTIEKDTIHETQILYSWVNSLNIRKEPNLNSEVLIKLKEGAKVKFNGKTDGKETTVTLRDKKITSNFYEITTASGTKGWAFGGALKPIEQKIEPTEHQKVIHLEDKILTLEETQLEQLWLNHLEIVTENKLQTIFNKKNISFKFKSSTPEQGEYFEARYEDKVVLEINVKQDSLSNHIIQNIRILSPEIADQYGIFVGKTYEEVKKLRPYIIQSTNTDGETIAYQRKSNLMYKICCAKDAKDQYSDLEAKTWLVEEIIWRQNY